MFELFQMKENETITKIITRFTDITNSLVALGKQYTQVETVRKVLRALTPKWEKKIITIEANDLSILTLENFIRNLIAYEVQLQKKRKDEQKRRKYFAFKGSSDTKDSDDEEEDIAMISRKFKKFLLKGNFKKNKETNDNLLCYKCNKPGHIKNDCPLLKAKVNFNRSTKKKKKVFQAT